MTWIDLTFTWPNPDLTYIAITKLAERIRTGIRPKGRYGKVLSKSAKKKISQKWT